MSGYLPFPETRTQHCRNPAQQDAAGGSCKICDYGILAPRKTLEVVESARVYPAAPDDSQGYPAAAHADYSGDCRASVATEMPERAGNTSRHHGLRRH
jgi:hypothetical protein